MEVNLGTLGVKHNILTLALALKRAGRKKQSIAFHTKSSQIHIHVDTVSDIGRSVRVASRVSELRANFSIAERPLEHRLDRRMSAKYVRTSLL